MAVDLPPRNPELLSAVASLLVVVDVQERLLPRIADGANAAKNAGRLLKTAEVVGVPAAISEQYPHGLGRTVDTLLKIAETFSTPVPIVEKLRFSAVESLGWPAAAEREDSRFQVVLAGLETHVCVAQTAFDLIAQGYRVFVAADAAGSQNVRDHAIALGRLRDNGATVTTTEAILFEWCEAAGTETFARLRPVILDRAE